MAVINFPLNPGYTERWAMVKEKGWFLNYVKWAMFVPDTDNYEACSIKGGYWGKIHVINSNGQDYVKGEPFIEFCMPIVEKDPPDTAMIMANGTIRVMRETEVGWQGLVKQLVEAILRSIGVFAMIGTVAGIQPMADMFTNVAKKFGTTVAGLQTLLENTFETYQKAAAWIDHYVNVDLMERLNTIGRSLVPEYDLFWREQENMLASASSRIFGNTATVSTYVHIAEMMYMDIALASYEDPDTARYEAAKHGAQVTKNIRLKLNYYERNPSALWGDIMRETFGEGNPYLDPERKKGGLAIIEQLNKMATVLEKTDKTLDRLGAYAVDFDKVNLGNMSTDIGKFIQWAGDELEETFGDFKRTVQKEYKEQKTAVDKLNKDREDEKDRRERSFIISSDPESLKPEERTIQSNHFLKTFDYAVPGLNTPGDFVPFDIEDMFNGTE